MVSFLPCSAKNTETKNQLFGSFFFARASVFESLPRLFCLNNKISIVTSSRPLSPVVNRVSSHPTTWEFEFLSDLVFPKFEFSYVSVSASLDFFSDLCNFYIISFCNLLTHQVGFVYIHYFHLLFCFNCFGLFYFGLVFSFCIIFSFCFFFLFQTGQGVKFRISNHYCLKKFSAILFSEYCAVRLSSNCASIQ